MPSPCAHRCSDLHAAALRLSTRTGAPVAVERLNLGIDRDYVPISGRLAPRPLPTACPTCGGICASPLAAAECHDPSPSPA